MVESAESKKIFVLDTNVILHDPNSLFAFEDNEVVIPIYVIEEIDHFKKDLSELGRNAREAARILDGLRVDGSLTRGVATNGGGTVRVAITNRDLPPEFCYGDAADNKIVATALNCAELSDGREVTFVTKDVNLRIRADALGLRVEDFDSERTDISELYSGVAEIELPGESIDKFYRDGRLSLPDPYYYPNQFAFLKDIANPAHTALGKLNLDAETVEPLIQVKEAVWGIRPRNREQCFAIDVLMNDNIKLVTLVGKAGTGKTLLAIAAGLHKVTEESIYQRLLISRPIFPLGRDIGYLPGDIEEKMMPWMQPIFDNVELLMGASRSERRRGRSYQELMDMGILEIEPLTYIRGRSIPNQVIIVDEAQNLTPHEVKTIISRAGDNTKFILTGDPYQIDNPYVDSTNNGLVHIVNHFKSERIAGHITLMKGERSDLAELAANLL
ncbi:MAG: phosphate starvation-inducible protein PhoH [Deltaproteobacteria bacterium RIFOXYA12_FULL_58_15]|nr:MAG: phosphate starvation-inducible protein PhoH [Deltaproteobacteria bacterium RIFOXYA12_FULL_58_15]